jgi:hypothetical protein
MTTAIAIKTPPQDNGTGFEARLEAIAIEIECVQTTAILRVAKLVEEAREMFLYNRDEGGFTGWIEQRLNMSQRTAYNLLDVHKQFGDQSLQLLQTLPRKILYLIARESTPEEARREVIERAENGEHFTEAQVKEIVDEAVRKAVEERLKSAREEADRREEKVRAEYDGLATPEAIQAQVDNATAPLRKTIEAYERKIAKLQKQEERDRIEREQRQKEEQDKTAAAASQSAPSLEQPAAERKAGFPETELNAAPPRSFVDKVNALYTEANQLSTVEWGSNRKAISKALGKIKVGLDHLRKIIQHVEDQGVLPFSFPARAPTDADRGGDQ